MGLIDMSVKKERKVLRATIRDVAREAEVSISTVSRYLNGTNNISAKTSQKIADVIERLRYTPNTAARALRGTGTKTVLLIVPDVTNPYYGQIVRSVQWNLDQNGYAMILFDSNGSTREETAVEAAQHMGINGIMLASLNIQANIVQKLLDAKVPVVLLNSCDGSPFDAVFGDIEQCSYVITQNFIALGHTRIAFAGGNPEYVHEKGRRRGYERAMREAGLEVDPRYIVEVGFLQSDGYECGRMLAELSPLPSAVCCANDLIALGLMSALHELGISIPEQMSVAGVDNIPYGQISWPSLTSISNDAVAFARVGVRMLMERIEGKTVNGPRNVIIRREFIMRDSVAPYRDEKDREHAAR